MKNKEIIKKFNNDEVLERTYGFVTNFNCNLACKYCFERNKKNKVLKIEDAKDFIDACFERDFSTQYAIDNCSASIDMIGGESLLYPELMDNICDYALSVHKKYGLKQRLHIVTTTNGTLLRYPKQQEFVKKWQNYISFGFSIDGTKEIHDLARVYKNGKGSYDDAVAGWEWFKNNTHCRTRGVKATFNHNTFKKYAECHINLIELGFNDIHSNCVYEEIWNDDDALILFEQMSKITDYLFEHNLERQVFIDCVNSISGDGYLYNPSIEVPVREGNYCGAHNTMTILGLDRNIYGCHRFATSPNPHPYAKLEGKKIVIIDQKFKDEQLKAYTQRPEECLKCKFVNSCGGCLAVPLDEGITLKEFYSQKRYCGFTKAAVASRLYFMDKYLDKYHTTKLVDTVFI